jgi:hypothetical protein
VIRDQGATAIQFRPQPLKADTRGHPPTSYAA